MAASGGYSEPIYLASYPRSGNTFLRMVLLNCFGLKTGSIYPADLGRNQALERFVGHIEHDAFGDIAFPQGNLPLLKTHELPRDDLPAIYIVRDGRAACASLWKFQNQSLPLAQVIAGAHRFGTWSQHVAAWHPWERRDTLFIRYEDMVADLPATIARLGRFLGRRPISMSVPSREEVALVDGRWVTPASEWEPYFTDDLKALFEQHNGPMLRQLGYELPLPPPGFGGPPRSRPNT